MIIIKINAVKLKQSDTSTLETGGLFYDLCSCTTAHYLQLLIFGTQYCILLPDELLELGNQLLGLGQLLRHLRQCWTSSTSTALRRTWGL